MKSGQLCVDKATNDHREEANMLLDSDGKASNCHTATLR